MTDVIIEKKGRGHRQFQLWQENTNGSRIYIASYKSREAAERALMVRLFPQLGEFKTIESFSLNPKMTGNMLGLGVAFKKSGKRFGITALSIGDCILCLREYVAEFPYGKNPDGSAWMPRK